MTQVENKQLVIIGCSAGGLAALLTLLEPLPPDFGVPIVVIQHMKRKSEELLIEVLDRNLRLTTCEAIEGDVPLAGFIYVAPGGYHLLFERDGSFALSLDPPQMGSRPSLDVAIGSAADAFADELTTIILSGNNKDGSLGAEATLRAGGRVYIQDPNSADYPIMPTAAADAVKKLKKTTAPVAPLTSITKALIREVKEKK